MSPHPTRDGGGSSSRGEEEKAAIEPGSLGPHSPSKPVVQADDSRYKGSTKAEVVEKHVTEMEKAPSNYYRDLDIPNREN